MPLTEQLTTEIDNAVEQEMSEQKAREAQEAKKNQEIEEGDGDGEGESEDENGEVEGGEGKEGESEGEGEGEESGESEGGEGEGSEGGEGEGEGGEGAGGTPTKKTVSDFAIEKAVQAGISLEDARSFPSEESLLRVVANLDVVQQEQARLEEQIAASTAAAAAKDVGDQEGDIFAALPKLDPEDYSPEVIKMFDTFREVIIKQQETLKRFEEQQQTTTLASQQVAAQEVEQWFDTEIKNLGDGFSGALGTGGYGSLVPGSPQLAKRNAIAEQMAITLKGYEANGLTPPPREKVFDAAARFVLQDEFAQKRSKELADELKKRQGQHISRASGQKNQHSQSSEEETAALIDKKFFGK